MSRSRFLSSVAAVSVGLLLFGACGAESPAEPTAEAGFEQTVEAERGSEIDADDSASVAQGNGDVATASDVEVPEQWPGVIGSPATLVPGSESYSVVEVPGVTTGISAVYSHAENDPFAQEVVAALLADGWTGNSTPTSDGGLGALLQKDGRRIQIVADPTNLQIMYTEPASSRADG